MKKIILLFVFVFSLTFVTLAQVVDADAQMFGNSRPVTEYNVHDFGKIDQRVEHQFVVKNPTPTSLTVTSIIVPDGFGVILFDKVVEPKSVGKFVVIIDPAYVEKEGDFEEKVILTTQQENALGVTTKEITYTVKGSY